MALGKNPRIDGRRPSSSYCSTFTIVAFVALCLVGVWMMTSSAVVPVQNVNVSPSETNSEVKQQIVDEKSREFEDSSGDLPDDATKGDVDSVKRPIQDDATSKSNEKPEQSDDGGEKQVEKFQEKTPSKEAEDVKNFSGETLKTEASDGGEENGEGREETDESESKQDNEKDSEGEKLSDSKETEGEKHSEEKESAGAKQVEEKELDEQKLNEKESDGDSKSEEKEVGADEKESGDEKKSSDQESESKKKSESDENLSGTGKDEDKKEGSASDEKNEVFPDGAQSEILNETSTQNGVFSTQAVESKNEKDSQEASKSDGNNSAASKYSWKLCNVAAGPDYIPCLDNEKAIKKLRSTKHYEHRERHCPEEGPTCLVPLREGYKSPVKWPNSRDKIWYLNVPHTKLAVLKGHQNWVKVSGEYLTFPGGGTQFKHGALHYIDFLQEAVPDIDWGKRSRVVLDVGCGVASFGGYLFDKDVLTMSFAPKDEHEAQVQFALERGIPAISAVMGTKRLPYPSMVFDVVHCARCRVPWHIEGGKLLLELNRVLRPGGYFVWSATPVYQKLEEDVQIWKEMTKLTKAMCWDLVTIKKDAMNQVAAAIYKKPSSNSCYEQRAENSPPLCSDVDDPNAAWNVPLQACIHRVPDAESIRGSKWPEIWPERVEKVPYWLNDSQVGVYGKPAPEDFMSDYQHWKHVVTKSYLNGMGFSWEKVRNVMDMRSVYGGFAAALKEMNMWVMNVVSVDAPDTLPIIYERGLLGMYHDWCESFSTYPRTYDLLHADHLFSKITKRCKLASVFAEVDRILRPEGKLIVRDKVDIINEIESMAKSLQWEVRLTYSKNKEGLLCVQKSFWRPQEIESTPESTNNMA